MECRGSSLEEIIEDNIIGQSNDNAVGQGRTMPLDREGQCRWTEKDNAIGQGRLAKLKRPK